MEVDELKRSVMIVGEAWKSSPYYMDAERWTFVFWEKGGIFRKMLDQMDLEITLELACGHGRHAERVASLTSRLILMDIHEENLAVCRERLKEHDHIEYVLNNGYDFQPVSDSSLSAIFCYDAMVHFSQDIVQSYLYDAARVLKPGGMALFHHSNYPGGNEVHYGQNPHARNRMTQELFMQMATNAGLMVVESVIIPWGGIPDLDCLTLLKR